MSFPHGMAIGRWLGLDGLFYGPGEVMADAVGGDAFASSTADAGSWGAGIGLVDLDMFSQWRTVRAFDGVSELVQPPPSCLRTAKTGLMLPFGGGSPLPEVTRQIGKNHLARPVLVCSKIVPARIQAGCGPARPDTSHALFAKPIVTNFKDILHQAI